MDHSDCAGWHRHGWTRRDFVRAAAVTVVGGTMAGCGSSTEPEPSGSRLSARPGTPTVTPDLGLTDFDVEGGGHAHLYVPASYDPATPAALVIGLHGAGGSPDDWTSYRARADSRGMVFVAPKSRGATWDLVEVGGFGRDVVLLDGALAYTFDRCAIDPARIALAGFSDGGTYALSLGVSNGDVLTHLIGYSPGYLASSPPTVGMPRIFISHGLSDPIIPISSSRDSTVPILQDAGYDVTYLEFNGGHEVPAAISESALDWLFDISP